MGRRNDRWETHVREFETVDGGADDDGADTGIGSDAGTPAAGVGDVDPPGGTVLVALLVAATFVVILNETLLSVALPVLAEDLGVGEGTVQWLASSYMLTLAIVIPATGFLLQRLTTRRAFTLSMGLFTVGTLIAAAAPGFWMLLLGRVVQACGTAIMMPLTMTVVMAVIPPERLGAVMGLVSMAIGVAPAIGPTTSGIVLHVLSWRFLFILMLPIALVSLLWGLRRVVDVGERTDAPVDLPSLPLSVIGFGGVVFGVSTIAGDVVPGAAAIIVGLAAIAAFGWRQLRLSPRGRALLDLGVFRVRSFTLALVLVCIAMFGLFGPVIVLPLYLTRTVGLEPMQIGMMMAPGGLLMGLAGRPVGALADRFGPRPVVIPGMALLAASLWAYSRVTPDVTTPQIVLTHLVFSIGLGMLFTPLFTMGLGELPSELHSHGSAVISALEQLAAAISTAGVVMVMGAVAEATGDATTGASVALMVTATVATLGFLAAFAIRPGRLNP